MNTRVAPCHDTGLDHRLCPCTICKPPRRGAPPRADWLQREAEQHIRDRQMADLRLALAAVLLGAVFLALIILSALAVTR